MKNELLTTKKHRCKLVLRKPILILGLCTVFIGANFHESFALKNYAQTKRIDLSVYQTDLITVLKKIEESSEFSFFYSNQIVDSNYKVTAEIKGKLIEEVLDEVLKNTGLKYTINDRQIVLSPKNESETSTLQERSVTGKVTDQDGLGLPGVTITIKGTSAGVITDNDGNYIIPNVPEGATLIFSFVGLLSQEIFVGTRTSLDVIMVADITELEEIVVIGYGTESMKKISGSITKVAVEDFNKGVNRNAADLLQGKVAGLTITTEGGDVTATQTIRLRGTSSLTGSSSPFVVIDGVPGLDLWTVAPEDIESISVLKDAAATAIYGSRSASGVILITTKKGRPGQTSVQYSGYLAASEVSNYPDMLSAAEWRNYAEENNLDVSSLDKGANTDWFDEILRTGISQNHNVSISGGLKNGSYRASLNYQDVEGVMKDNFLQRTSGLFSVNQRFLNERLNLSLNANTIMSDFQPTNGYNTILAYNMLPVYPVYNEDGSYFEIIEYDQGNPVNNMDNNSDVHKTSSSNINLKADFEILKGLTAGANLFTQRKSDDGSYYAASTTTAGRNSNGYANRTNSLWNKELFELTLDYKKNIGRHSFGVIGGYSWEENIYQSVGASNRNFINDSFGADNLSIGEDLRPTDVNSYKSSYNLISFFGRANYSFDDKYIFTLTYREDGSSKFGQNNKWGSFPSASVAWRLSDEGFMSNVTAISNIKLRAGYGVVGNQDGIGPYNSIALYRRGDEYYDQGKWHNSFIYAQNHNPDLRWEQTATFNPGLDFGLFKSKVGVTVDYYIKKTSDLLYVYSVPVPPFLYPNMLANVGDMTNEGIELLINAQVVEKPNFTWDLTFNFAHNKNKIDRLSNEVYSTDRILTGSVNLRGSGYLTSSIIEEGQEVGTFYNLKFKELDEDGKWVIEDIEEDGQITPADYTYIGHANPDFTYGLLNNFRYKRFDFSFFLRGVNGNDVLNSPRVQYGNQQWLPGINVLSESLTNGINDTPLFSSYYIEDGSFLRLDNASLAYNVNVNKLKGFSKCRVYITGQNLFVITNFTGPDPEVNMSGLSPGVMEQYFIPKPITVSLGIELGF